TAARLKQLKLINHVVPEPLGGAHRNYDEMAALLRKRLLADLSELRRLSTEQLLDERYQRLMSFGYC
ncbi:MAG: acetyl-CoA carboxylase carboxyl transferase subunit alpha, partial [Aeromonadaceae bacterium]